MFLETKEVADNDTAPCSEADSQSSTVFPALTDTACH